MTAIDRFDPFERRIEAAIHEIAADRQPDYLDDVFRLTAGLAQRPGWTFPERWISVNQGTLRAAVLAAVVIAALGGGYALGPGRGPGSAQPTPSPSPTASAGPSPTLEAVLAAPQTLWGDWLADVDAIPAIDMPAGMIQLSVSWERGDQVWLQTTPDYRQLLASVPLAAPDGELRLRSNAASQCPLHSEGRYRWTRSPDGLFLTLDLIEDACADRATVFARTWVHSLGAVNDGGPGVAYGVTPMTQMTLPTGQRMAAEGGEQSQVVKTFGDVQPFRAFVVVRNPGGFGAPCSTSDTQKADIAHTTEAFTTYVEGLPGAAVTTTTTQVGGRPAVRLDVSIDAAVDCASGSIEAFHPENLADTYAWAFEPGEVQPLYIVQMDAATTFLLWFQGTADEHGAVIDSIQFIDKLPMP